MAREKPEREHVLTVLTDSLDWIGVEVSDDADLIILELPNETLRATMRELEARLATERYLIQSTELDIKNRLKGWSTTLEYALDSQKTERDAIKAAMSLVRVELNIDKKFMKRQRVLEFF